MNTKDFKTRSETIHRAAPCPANHWVIGLDIGYSAIKGMSPGNINDPDLSNIYSNVRGYYYQRVNQIR